MSMQGVGIAMQQIQCMKAQQKKLSGCASNSLAHEDLGHFEEAHHWNIQAKFYNERFPLVYESDNKWDSLYHEDHGAILKHNCGKRIVTLPLLSFSLFFLFFCFFVGFFGLFFYHLPTRGRAGIKLGDADTSPSYL